MDTPDYSIDLDTCPSCGVHHHRVAVVALKRVVIEDGRRYTHEVVCPLTGEAMKLEWLGKEVEQSSWN